MAPNSLERHRERDEVHTRSAAPHTLPNFSRPLHATGQPDREQQLRHAEMTDRLLSGDAIVVHKRVSVHSVHDHSASSAREPPQEISPFAPTHRSHAALRLGNFTHVQAAATAHESYRQAYDDVHKILEPIMGSHDLSPGDAHKIKLFMRLPHPDHTHTHTQERELYELAAELSKANGRSLSLARIHDSVLAPTVSRRFMTRYDI